MVFASELGVRRCCRLKMAKVRCPFAGINQKDPRRRRRPKAPSTSAQPRWLRSGPPSPELVTVSFVAVKK